MPRGSEMPRKDLRIDGGTLNDGQGRALTIRSPHELDPKHISNDAREDKRREHDALLVQVALVHEQVANPLRPTDMGVAIVPLECVLEVVPCDGEDRVHRHLVDLVLVNIARAEFLPCVKLARPDGIGDFAQGLREGDDQGTLWIDLRVETGVSDPS